MDRSDMRCVAVRLIKQKQQLLLSVETNSHLRLSCESLVKIESISRRGPGTDLMI